MAQQRKKNVYCLRIRRSDSEPWSEPAYFRTSAERNNAERVNRIIGGVRTHSYEESKTPDEIETMVQNEQFAT